MSVQKVQSIDIYHGLPVYPDDVEGLTAVITGANGISGYHMLRVLGASPKRWSKIYCLSRRPPYIPGGLPANAEHVALDFLKSPDEIAGVLQAKGVRADYVFFFAYLQPAPKEGGGLWSDADEMDRVNALLLSNFVEAMRLAHLKPRRFMLQTGAKNYGVHLGPTKLPQEESDPRVELEPNFYYSQEDFLFKYCQEEGIGWNVLMPCGILGAVPDAATVYAAVCVELEQPLLWPSDISSWQTYCSQSSAMMNAYMEEWAVLTPGAENQRFNACDDSAFTWEGFWPHLAGWYGLEWRGPDDKAEFHEIHTRFNPRGYGPSGVVRTTFTFVEWAKRPEVQKAWKRLAEKHDLSQKELKDVDRVFGFLDGSVSRAGSLMMSMAKSRKLGWHGTVDTTESFLAVFEDLVNIKMIPPVPKINVSLR
ncbi:hypothetical protein PFICI_10369 [Pestalotiopsis fici W106-1]|uniref:PRISE-like Rossmann-fold domain-containing protein n=1 Tax=Pestalotiopsis fici (strain W106-1 / CGMCC3.15140) TaxID=1229662 RepID=W3WYX6_PESFW|nr:uncharacterized protein PFICI_10369 [Pestalotiopsis fici W106-1]ETS78307.1 hypothetical protein PFICI_10369 [Pestalotiopsis fici W106-1]